jgi:hypothetical protein
MYWDVIEVKPENTREFRVKFDDGLSGHIVIDSSFCSGVFKALLDDDLLRQASADNGVVTWPNGLDLAPDTMYNEIKSNPERRYVLK